MKAQNINHHQWKNRILLIKTKYAKDSIYLSQLKEFSNAEKELAERKLILYQIVGEQYKVIDYQNPSTKSQWKHLEKVNEGLFEETDQFTIRLIGLDGGIKLEKTEVIKKEKLFRLIDSMPMRLRELEKKKRNGK